jgi:hypothetical protein
VVVFSIFQMGFPDRAHATRKVLSQVLVVGWHTLERWSFRVRHARIVWPVIDAVSLATNVQLGDPVGGNALTTTILDRLPLFLGPLDSQRPRVEPPAELVAGSDS